MKTYVTADLHLGHNNISKYRSFKSYEEHDKCIISNWNQIITKRDKVIVLGDAAFSLNGLEKLNLLCGIKMLILGNHDPYPFERYKKYFGRPRLWCNYKNRFIMTHVPVHPGSLRGKINVHGHVHKNTIQDSRYINVSLDVTDFKPILLEELQ